jgi:hypothetical protein
MADSQLLNYLRSSSAPFALRCVWFWAFAEELIPAPPLHTWHNAHTKRVRARLNSKPWLATTLVDFPVHPRTSPPTAREELALPAFAKPIGGCGGQGITVVRTLDELLAVPASHIVQEGIMDPTTAGGRKLDYRVFALLSSDGLCAVHRLALVRPSALPYDAASSDPRVQLTNSSLHGEEGLFVDELPASKLTSVLEAIAEVASCVGLRANEYAIVGADVLLRRDGSTVLLELNASWDRQVVTEACAIVKSRALADLLALRAGGAAAPLLVVVRKL